MFYLEHVKNYEIIHELGKQISFPQQIIVKLVKRVKNWMSRETYIRKQEYC